ncbi:MAG: PEP-CTERM sorting domain-containing protein [Massilia sp.]
MNMNMTKPGFIAALIAASALLCGAASATTIIGADQVVTGVPMTSGLAGTFWHTGTNTTNYMIAETLAARDANTPNGHFTSTGVSYFGVDASTVTDFLASDSASYAGSVTDLSDGIFEFKGFIKVDGPGTITFGLSHDDATQLSIGNQILISANCCGFQTEDAVFSAAGMYAIDLVYANTYYFNVGGAVVELSANGQVIRDGLFQAVPEPGSAALMLIGALGLMGVASRRKAIKK